jgi:phosphoglucosamine mutase
MCAAVREHGARLGIAHDGDGDRCVLCDEHGEVLDGDEILTVLALHALRAGRLGADTLVVTVQSNLGVDAALAAAGGRVVRTPVGDRHVAEKMRELGATLGGESSGHIICADVSPTGDGLIAALRVMEVMRATGQPLSELRRWLKKFPQASTTVAIAPGAPKPPLETMPQLTAAIRALEAELGARGRVLARWSGTEPKLRLLVEGPEDVAVRDGLARLAAAARADLGV